MDQTDRMLQFQGSCRHNRPNGVLCSISDLNGFILVITALENFTTKLVIKNNDKFDSPNAAFKNKLYTSYKLDPDSATIQSMEIINLKKSLVEVVGATIQ